MKEHDLFLTPEAFLSIIQDRMIEKRINMIDAVLDYCTEYCIDVDDVVPLITRPMKELIKNDAMKTGLIMKEASLPV